MDDLMFKVPNGQNPYSAIGKYIRDNTTTIEDMIAVIEIDGITMNELFLVDMHEDGYFVWKSDWWEGEKDIALIDFFPVSDAQKLSVQPEPCEDAVSREEVLNCLEWQYPDKTPRTKIMELPPVTPEQRTGKWLWQTGKIRCNQCLSAIRRIDHDGLLNFCPNCGVKIMEGANNEGN